LLRNASASVPASPAQFRLPALPTDRSMQPSAIVLNSMPKSAPHLMMQIAEALPGRAIWHYCADAPLGIGTRNQRRSPAVGSQRLHRGGSWAAHCTALTSTRAGAAKFEFPASVYLTADPPHDGVSYGVRKCNNLSLERAS